MTPLVRLLHSWRDSLARMVDSAGKLTEAESATVREHLARGTLCLEAAAGHFQAAAAEHSAADPDAVADARGHCPGCRIDVVGRRAGDECPLCGRPLEAAH